MHGKVENIQALRGLAALLVLFAHIAGAERDYGGGRTFLPDWFQIGLTGVDLFFLISGYVMVHVTARSNRGGQPAAQFLFNRAGRIYPLYWIASALLLIFYFGKLILFKETTPIDNAVASFLLLPDTRLPILSVGWTLVHEMYFYFIFAIFMFFSARVLPLLLASWATAILLLMVSGAGGANAWASLIFSPLTFEFIAGCAIAMVMQKSGGRHGGAALIAGILILFILTAGFFDRLYPDAMTDHMRRVLTFGPPYALVLYGAVALEAQNRLKAPAWLIKIGDASYALYLMHLPVLLVTGKSLSLISADAAWFNLVLIGAYLGVALGAAFAAHYWLEKPALRFTKKLSGRFFRAPAQEKITK